MDWRSGACGRGSLQPRCGGRKAPEFAQTGEILNIRMPAEAPDPNVTVIAFETR
jgi:hypothetical protein